MTAAIAARGAEEIEPCQAKAAQRVSIAFGQRPLAQRAHARKAKRQRGAHGARGAGYNR